MDKDDCWKLVASELFDELEDKLRSNPQPKWVSAMHVKVGTMLKLTQQ